MQTQQARTSAQIRAEVGHPIIDTDGHVLELIDASHPYLREALGPKLFDRFLAEGLPVKRAQAAKSLDERRRSRTPQGAWWGTHTTNVRDRATATLPALMYERMEELGLDYSVLYPTNTLTTGAIEDEDMRRGVCAGFNEFYADIYGPFSDRFTAAAYIPMHTPEEAIAELHHCKQIGIKVVVFPEGVLRPIDEPAGPNSSLWLFPGQTHWLDVFAIDSIYDYDPVWQTCLDLGYAVTFHGGVAFRPGLHTSISSYVANHIGQFAAAMYPLCKALHLGGVTRRFPQLPFVFLECGVSWGVQLLSDTIEHWEKRNLDALRRNFDPARLDRDQLADYYKRYGGKLVELLPGDPYEYVQGMPIHGAVPEQPDEFAAMQVSSVDDLIGTFVDSFYFGCEADDRGITTAFSPANPHGATLRPIIGSDIGHWDVTDIAKVVVESHELVEEGFLSPEQFRAFTCDNAVRMYTAANPSFFEGTVVADAL